MIKHQTHCLLGLLAMALLSACHGGPTGPVEEIGSDRSALQLQFAANPAEDIDELWLQIRRVSLLNSAGQEVPYADYGEAGRALHLQWADGVSVDQALTDVQDLPPGRYTGVRVLLAAQRGVVDSRVQKNGLVHDLEIAASDAQVLDLPINAELAGGKFYDWGIEINLRLGLKAEGGIYTLRPLSRQLNKPVVGSIGGSVAETTRSSACSDGHTGAVYVFNGRVEAGDYGASDAQAISSPLVRGANHSYYARWLPAGRYTLAWTCDSHLDRVDAADSIRFHGTQAVDLGEGRYHELNF